MKVLPINFVNTNRKDYHSKSTENNSLGTYKNIDLINKITSYNVVFKGNKHFDLNLSEEELRMRTTSETFTPIWLIDEHSSAYKQLSKNDKESLQHLIKAADCFENVYLELDNKHNIEFLQYLDNEIKKGNVNALLTKKLFNGQRSIIGNDTQRNPVILAKGIKEYQGKGFYPEDLSVDEFHKILKDMLLNGETEEVKNILNQRSVVVRNDEKLKAVDYTEYFKTEFSKAADELDLAAKSSSSPEFAEYLTNQAMALRKNDPNLDCKADKLWAKLQNTPLEFTISRECYTDKMTPTVNQNQELSEMLKEFGIVAYAKDNIGVRAGIVDKKGSEYLLKTRELLPYMASKMPLAEHYVQKINKNNLNGSAMIDVDLAHVSGHFAEYRGSITIASNLPNGDKLSVQTGGGRRMVYHKQMRNAKCEDGNLQKKLNLLLNPAQHKFFNPQGIHDFTILHENVHSLGPKSNLERLSIYKNTIEEFKANTGALVMLDELTQIGFYTPKREQEAIISYLTQYVPKGYDVSHAHRTCEFIEYNKFFENGAITLSDKGVMTIDCKKVIKAAREMLEDAIRIQLKGSAEDAEKYIQKYASWNNCFEMLANNLKATEKKLNSYVVSPLLKTIIR